MAGLFLWRVAVFWSVVAVSVGAVVGANARWFLGLWLNTPGHAIPLGTLTANIVGGWLVGVLIAFFSTSHSLTPEWRLLLITGFCGALTTFSTFSTEMVGAFQTGKWALALLGIGLHVAGTLLATVLGMFMFRWFHA